MIRPSKTLVAPSVILWFSSQLNKPLIDGCAVLPPLVSVMVFDFLTDGHASSCLFTEPAVDSSRLVESSLAGEHIGQSVIGIDVMAIPPEPQRSKSV